MNLVWGTAGQLKFKDEKEYYKALGLFANPKLTRISWEKNTQTGSYADAYRLKILPTAPANKLPNAVKKALRDANRINCNPYVLNLIDNHGFAISGNAIMASYEDVIRTIPKSKAECILAFIEGYNLASVKEKPTKSVSYNKESIEVADATLKIKSFPEIKAQGEKRKPVEGKRTTGKRDYIQKTIDDFEIGEAGERIVFINEKKKLLKAKEKGLISDFKGKLEWVSRTDDSAGFDIKSYDPETKRTMYIEVKTTTGSVMEPFYMSENEIRKSNECGEDYYIYRIYKLDRKKTNMVECYVLNGDIKENKKLTVTPNGYVVRISIK